MLRQRTLQREVSAAGIGLHSGKLIWITIKPSEVNSGVTFRRKDLSPARDIRVSVAKVVSTNLASTIDEDGVSISTVEHLSGRQESISNLFRSPQLHSHEKSKKSIEF